MTIEMEEELQSVLTIAGQLRAGAEVFCYVEGMEGRQRVKNVRACAHLPKREVQLLEGWRHATRVFVVQRAKTAAADVDDAGAQTKLRF